MKVKYSSFKQYAIIFLIISIKNYGATAHVKNTADEQPSIAKVLLSYLEVPWINLNTSWIDVATPECKNDIEILFESANAGEMWALRMLDSASKIPAGFLTGNIRDLGMYDQCINVKAQQNRANIQGRHCMVSFSMPTKYVDDPSEILFVQKVSIYNPTADVDFSFTASLCLPSSCGVNDVTGFVNASIQSRPDLVAFEINVVEVSCSNDDTTDDFYLGRMLTLILCATIVSLLLICTICDFVVRASSNNASPSLNTAAKFSLYTNVIKLASTKTGPGTMPALHGIRFINTCLIVMGHRTIGALIIPHVNLADAWVLRQTILAEFIHALPYVVDTFFVMSGFLTTYLFLKALREGQKLNVLVLYVHRYLRLTPCLAVLLLFSVFFLPNIGSGPMWGTVTGVATEFCRKNWWANLLYVQNFVNPEEMCMLHTWYLAVEMQLFWISPLILYPLFYRPKFGITILTLLTIIFLIVPAAHLSINQLPVLFNVQKNIKEMYHEFFSSYPVTYNRVLPYLIGIILGYDVANNKRQFTKGQVFFNWILSAVLVLFSIGITYFIQPNAPKFDVIWEMIYVSVARLGWSIAMAWIFYACTHGHGGVATRFLSLPMFVPLSRMCYSIYLVHFVLQLSDNASVRTAEYNTPFSIIYLIWGDLAFSITIAFILTLCLDSPLIALEKILLSKHSPSTEKPTNSNGKNKELWDVITEYLDRTKTQDHSDLSIKGTPPQVNLKRTISQVLKNSLVNGATKTPTEWAKSWQDWKSYFVGKDNQWEASAGDGAVDSQNETLTLEKELFVFLAGVSCGLDENLNVESEIIKGSKSQLESPNWRNDDSGRISTLISTPKSYFSGPTSTEIEHRKGRLGTLP